MPLRRISMECPFCKAELPESAKFCPECGGKIVRNTTCPNCGTEAVPGAKFCMECGHKFDQVVKAKSTAQESLPETPRPDNSEKFRKAFALVKEIFPGNFETTLSMLEDAVRVADTDQQKNAVRSFILKYLKSAPKPEILEFIEKLDNLCMQDAYFPSDNKDVDNLKIVFGRLFRDASNFIQESNPKEALNSLKNGAMLGDQDCRNDIEVAKVAAIENADRLLGKEGNLKSLSPKDCAMIADISYGGDPHAKYLVGEIVCDGVYSRKDPKFALSLFSDAAKGGDRHGMFALGEALMDADENGPIKKDLKTAEYWINKGAEMEDDILGHGMQLMLEFSKEMAGGGEIDWNSLEPSAGVVWASSQLKPDESYTYDERGCVGFAYFVIGMSSITNNEYERAKDFFTDGAKLGNANCRQMLEQMA